MELKMNREILTTAEGIYDGVQEQSVELDYILPDYYPELCKVLQARMEPEIISYQLSGERISYELCVHVYVLYCAEKNPAVQCIHQKLNYSRSQELGRNADGAEVQLTPKSDYVNCRVINQRRIDLRGAVSVKLHVVGEQQQALLCDLFGLHTQTNKMPVTYAAKKLHSSKAISISEAIELSEAKPAILQILRHEVQLLQGETKTIAGKLVAKGEAQVHLLYTCADGMEPMSFTLPYSQIVDMDGVDDSFTCRIRAEVADCALCAVSKNDGDTRTLQCDLQIRLHCTARKLAATELVTDVFSTAHPCEPKLSPIRVEMMPVAMQEKTTEQLTLTHNDGELLQVYDAWCRTKHSNARRSTEDGTLQVSGMLAYCVLAKDAAGMPVLLEQETPFTHVIPNVGPDSMLSGLQVDAVNCSYTLAGANSVVIKAELLICGELAATSAMSFVTDVSIDADTMLPTNGACALKLYFGKEGEHIWDIAKRYHTSVSAIQQENNLPQMHLTQNGMLLIPIVS